MKVEREPATNELTSGQWPGKGRKASLLLYENA